MEATPLRILARCTDLPGRRFDDGSSVREPVFLGIQRGRDAVDLVPGDAAGATFMPEFRVTKQPNGKPNFLGPFAQGTPQDRFFYLVWCVNAEGEAPVGFRRLKVRLGHLGWGDVERGRAKPIEVHLKMRDARGGPLCATPPATHIEWRL